MNEYILVIRYYAGVKRNQEERHILLRSDLQDVLSVLGTVLDAAHRFCAMSQLYSN